MSINRNNSTTLRWRRAIANLCLAVGGASLLNMTTPLDASARCSCAGVQNIVTRARVEINNHTTDVGNYIVESIP